MGIRERTVAAVDEAFVAIVIYDMVAEECLSFGRLMTSCNATEFGKMQASSLGLFEMSKIL